MVNNDVIILGSILSIIFIYKYIINLINIPEENQISTKNIITCFYILTMSFLTSFFIEYII